MTARRTESEIEYIVIEMEDSSDYVYGKVFPLAKKPG